MKTNKESVYKIIIKNIDSLIEDESDLISKMSTVVCELFHSFEHWNWVGFYRMIDNSTLKVGPYQGTHGCLKIDINQGVCGKCARDKKIQIENDASKIPHHIPCSDETKSEIVLPVKDQNGILRAVLDIDSLKLNSFDGVDEKYLKDIVAKVY